MKTIVLGDTHGRELWKLIANLETFDRLIFIGDYFDSFDIDAEKQIANFLDIIKYKETSGKEVVLLIGNHDHHYFKSIGNTGTSGYQRVYAPTIEKVIEDNKHHLQMAYSIDNMLFTHAGVGELWLEKRYKDYPKLLNENEELKTAKEIAEFVNKVWDLNPEDFVFDGWNGYGDDMGQTPIWIRPQSLKKDSVTMKKNGIVQVVGHTGQKEILLGPYIFIDVLGTSKGFLIIEGNEVKIGKI